MKTGVTNVWERDDTDKKAEAENLGLAGSTIAET